MAQIVPMSYLVLPHSSDVPSADWTSENQVWDSYQLRTTQLEKTYPSVS